MKKKLVIFKKFLVSQPLYIGFLHSYVTLVVAEMFKMSIKETIYQIEKKEIKNEKKNIDILKFLVSIRPNIGFLHRNVTLVVAAMFKMSI